MKTAIITGSDKNYFFHLLNLCESLKSQNVLDNNTLCIFNIDFNEDQIKILSKYATFIKKPDWDFDISFKAKDWKKLLTVRPFIRDYFQGFDNYIWLDADTYILSNNFINVFKESLKYFEINIVPEYDFSYINFKKNSAYNNIFSNFYKISGWSHKNNIKYFNKNYADILIDKPILNAGIFSLKSNSFIWNLWKENFQNLIRKSSDEYCLNMDQASLNKVIYENIEKANLLNAKYNWLIKNQIPYVDDNKNFYNTKYPFEKIDILHFTQINLDKAYNFFNPFSNKLVKYKISFNEILNEKKK